MTAVVAHLLAIIFVERFSEVVQEYASSTNGGLGITGCLFDKLTAYFLFADGLLAQEFCNRSMSLMSKYVIQLPFSAVASCASSFLVIAFQAFGHVVVQYVSHIGFVDSHSKGDGRDNDVAILIEEGILVLHTFGSF
jgi:hypothetical protein